MASIPKDVYRGMATIANIPNSAKTAMISSKVKPAMFLLTKKIFLSVVMILNFFPINFAYSLVYHPLISFNKSPATDLVTVEGGGIITKDLAVEIVRFREAHGPYKTGEELLQVQGMTPSIFSIINPLSIDGDVVSVPK